MTDIVSPDRIEDIVGVKRHHDVHYGRAVSAEQTVYILHSELCRASGISLTDCRFSRALDRGIESHRWAGSEDRPVPLAVEGGRLIPAGASAERPRRCDETPHPEGAIPPLSEHDYRFGGDDPYVVCARCGERRDAITAWIEVDL